jgi:hypothetical protein
MIQRQYPVLGRLQYQLKDMRLGLALAEEMRQPLPVAAAATHLWTKVRASYYVLLLLLHPAAAFSFGLPDFQKLVG